MVALPWLKAAGAMVVGKTNLDQFATGLVGVRTPYPIPRNAVDASLVPGGSSSSASAVAVARGIVSFALGTDTAGSGRIPAGLNNIVGLKPTVGALSATGVVPACRMLDCISVFALIVDDAYAVYGVAAAKDPADAYSCSFVSEGAGTIGARPPVLRVGVPAQSRPCNSSWAMPARCRRPTRPRLALLQSPSAARLVELPFGDFYAVANLLYEGAWVAGTLRGDPGLHGRARSGALSGNTKNLSAAALSS